MINFRKITVMVFGYLMIQPLAAQPDQPNVILFLVDDMGWQDTSVPFWKEKTKWNRRYNTPHMEKLASDGVKFTDAYACSVCTPTRVSLMTGMNSARHRVTDWTSNPLMKGAKPRCRNKGYPLDVPVWNANGIAVDPDQPHSIYAKCLPSFLQEAGYRTIHVGKAHFAAKTTPAADPTKIGFDINIAGHAGGGPGSYLGTDDYAKKPGLEKYIGTGTFLTEALTLEANQAMHDAVSDQKPFFLYMAHYAIHVRFLPDDRFIEKYRKRGLPEKEAMYAALIEGMDKSLGDIVAKVEELGQTDNTVIIFMSDNGGLSAIGRIGKSHSHNSPLSSGKGSLHEGGIRVPMLVKWPGVTKANTICADPVMIEDFFTTILEIAGVKEPQQIGGVIDGKSFVPLLKGETELNKNRAFISHYPNHWGPRGPGINFCTSMRLGDWKLVYYHTPGRKGGQFELFNLSSDIGEQTNLANKNPERLKAMAKQMTEKLNSYNAQMPIVRKTGQVVDLPYEFIKTK